MWNSGLLRVCLVVLCLLAACGPDQPPVSEPPEPSTPVVTQVPVEEPAVPTTRVPETLPEVRDTSTPVTTQVFVGEEPVSTIVPTVDTLSESEEALLEAEGVLIEAIMDARSKEWSISTPVPGLTGWSKYVREPLVEYEDYPDPEQACVELLETLIAYHDLPGSPESHQAVLSSFQTLRASFRDASEEGYQDDPLGGRARGADGMWVWEGDYGHTGVGTGPQLECAVKDNGSESWDAHLPGVVWVAFSETHWVSLEDVWERQLEDDWNLVGWAFLSELDEPDKPGPGVSG